MWEVNYIFNTTAKEISRELFVLGDFNNGPNIPERGVIGELEASFEKTKSLGD